MLYQELYREWFDKVCFSSNQIYAWKDTFDKNNLGRWVRKGLLIKLRNGIYTFPEYLGTPDIGRYIANKIYMPSYISLHSALSFYGLIPEAIVNYTSITTLKTKTFENPFGTFVYKSLKPDLYFGYHILETGTGKSILMAQAEKAILDLLYIYPFYKSSKDFEDLRFDVDIFQDIIDQKTLYDLAIQFNNKSLLSRINTLIETYKL